MRSEDVQLLFGVRWEGAPRSDRQDQSHSEGQAPLPCALLPRPDHPQEPLISPPLRLLFCRRKAGPDLLLAS